MTNYFPFGSLLLLLWLLMLFLFSKPDKGKLLASFVSMNTYIRELGLMIVFFSSSFRCCCRDCYFALSYAEFVSDSFD